LSKTAIESEEDDESLEEVLAFDERRVMICVASRVKLRRRVRHGDIVVRLIIREWD